VEIERERLDWIANREEEEEKEVKERERESVGRHFFCFVVVFSFWIVDCCFIVN
jgi:hypothetical protein